MAGWSGKSESDSTARGIGFFSCPRGGIGRRARFRFSLIIKDLRVTKCNHGDLRGHHFWGEKTQKDPFGLIFVPAGYKTGYKSNASNGTLSTNHLACYSPSSESRALADLSGLERRGLGFLPSNNPLSTPGDVANLALPFAQFLKLPICSAINLESGTNSVSTRAISRSVGSFPESKAKNNASMNTFSISLPVKPSVALAS